MEGQHCRRRCLEQLIKMAPDVGAVKAEGIESNDLGRQIRLALAVRRETLGIPYSEVARRIGISVPSTLGTIKGDGDLRIATLLRFAEALELDVAIEFTDNAVPNSASREVDALPGLRKTVIAARVEECVSGAGVSVEESEFMGVRSSLPWRCRLMYPDLTERTYDFYIWTISHGGRSRRKDEYRVQTKLEFSDSLGVADGTTILGGYYNESVDRGGKQAGNTPPPGMEVLVFWDAIEHLNLGASSSCQVPFETMYQAYLSGYSTHERSLGNGRSETIIAIRPEYVASYLRAASGGHDLVDVSDLAPKRA